MTHFEIVGKDARVLRDFYGGIFGWHVGTTLPGTGIADYTLVHTDHTDGIHGGIGASADDYAGHLTFYVEVPDVASTLEAVERRGGKRMIGPSRVPGGPIIGLFRDPEGHVVGLMQAAAP